MAECRERGLPLVVRGAGHSCGGQSLGEGGVVLWNRSDVADARLEGDEVEVSGRTTWNALEAFLGARDRTPLVMPDHLDLTVGGTLSVGGYGVRSVAWGSQVDRVRSLRLITPDGNARWLDATDPLARHALAGLGRVGVIERVRMSTAPRRPAVRWCTREFTSLAGLAAWMHWVEAETADNLWIDAWHEGDTATAEWGIEAPDRATAKAATVPGPPPQQDAIAWHLPLRLHDQRSRWVASFPRHRRLWVDYMLPHGPFVQLCEFLDRARIDGSPSPNAVYVLASRLPPKHEPAVYSPSPWPMSYGVGAYFMVHPDRSTAEVEAALLRFADEARRLGGRPYRYGWGARAPQDEAMTELRRRVGAEPWFAPLSPPSASRP